MRGDHRMSLGLRLPLAALFAVIASAPACTLSQGAIEFYAIIPGGDGPVDLTEGKRLPSVVGATCFGWRTVRNDLGNSGFLSETLLLPHPAKNWNDAAATTIAPDGLSAVTKVPVKDGGAEHTWCVTEGDPTGRHQIEVRDAGKLLGSRVFSLEIRAKPHRPRLPRPMPPSAERN